MLPPPAAREAYPCWGALSMEAVGKEPHWPPRCVCVGGGHLLFSPPAKPRPLPLSRLHSSLWGLRPNSPHPEHLSELKLGLRPSGSTRHPKVP